MKKILIITLILLSATTAFANEQKLTIDDYKKKLHEYIDECNRDLKAVFNQYNEKVKATNDKIKALEKQKDNTHKLIMNCSLAQANADLNEVINGPCGHLYGKTTYFKTSSGLVVADDEYAINKCLAKLPQSKQAYVNPCEKEYEKYKKIDKDIEFQTKQFAILKQEKEKEEARIKADIQTKVDELANDCRQTYPLRRFYGYCQGIGIQFNSNN